MNATFNSSTTLTAPRPVTHTDIYNLAVHGIFGFLGVISNSVTIAIILKGKRFGHGMKIQLLNLAIVDFLCSLLSPVSGYIGGIVTLNYPNNHILCVLHQFITTILFCISLYCTVAISIERFVAVFFPLKIANYTSRDVIIVIAIGWISSFGFHIDIILFSGIYTIPEVGNAHMCLAPAVSKMLIWRIVNIFRFLVPVAMLLLSYISVGIKIARRKTIGERHMYSEQRRSLQVLTMLAVVGILTVITWSPYMVPGLISNFKNKETSSLQEPTVSNMVFFALMLSNCFSTNLVYLMFSKDYQKDMKQTIFGIKYRNPSTKSGTTETRSRLSALSTTVSYRPKSSQGSESL